MLRKLRNIIFSLLALLIIIIASITTIVETPPASRWVVTFVANKVGVHLGKMSGNLRNGMDIEFVEFRKTAESANEAGGVELKEYYYRADNISFRWSPVALFYGAISIQSLRADKLIIRLPATQEKTDNAPFNNWPHLGLPVRVELDELKVKDITYQQGDALQQFEKISGSLSLGTFHLRYEKLHVQHARYALTLSGLTDLDFPYETDAMLKWKFHTGEGEPESVVNVSSASSVANSSAAHSSVADSLVALATASSSVATAPVISASSRLDYAGITNIRGDLHKLHLNNTTSAPVELEADLDVVLIDPQNALKPTPLLKLDATWHAQTLPQAWWFAQQLPPTTSAHLQAEGEIHQYRASLTGDFALINAPPVWVEAKASGDLTQIAVDYLRIREQQLAVNLADNDDSSSEASASSSSSAADIVLDNIADNTSAIKNPSMPGVELSGKVQWLPHLEWQVAANAEALNIATLFADWPSNIHASFASRGSLKKSQWQAEITDLLLSGHVRDLQVEGKGSAVFDRNKLHTDALHLIWGANQFQVKGSVSDSLQVEWNLQAPLLGQLDPTISGSLISKGEVSGSWQLPQIKMEAKAEQFSWKNYSVDNLTLSLAPKVLPVLAADIKTPVPANLPAKENISTIENTVTVPTIQPITTLSTAALLAQEYVLDFSAKQLRVAGNRFSQLSLQGKGSINKHDLQAIIKSSRYGKAEFSLAGNLIDETWIGKLTQFDIKLKKVPRWWLTSSKTIRIDANSVVLDDVCLTTSSNLTSVVERNTSLGQAMIPAEWQAGQSPVKNPYAWLASGGDAVQQSKIEKLAEPQLCLQGDWHKATGMDAKLRLDSVPLRQFYALFKTEVFFAGVMDGTLRVATKDFSINDLQADMSVMTRGAELRYQFSGGNTEVYPWRNVSLLSTIAKGQLDANFAMEWQGYGQINASTQLNLVAQKINAGKFNATFSNLAPLETLLVFANDVKGDLLADLQFGGTFSNPYALGNIQLHNGSANLPKLGVDLKAVDILLTSTQAGEMALVSSAESGKGNINVRGDLQGFGSELWQLQGIVSGSDFQIISLPQLKATLSPNVQVTASREAIRLTGDAVIPWARTNIKTLPQTATQVSKDVVVLDDKNMELTQTVGIPVYNNINLALGDDVRFKGFGLDSQLSGKLNLLKDSQRQLLTTGFVSVKEGSYKAYNQTLKIERGRLIFQGDYENPGLDIRASREIEGTEKVTVGLEISGTLQRPTAKVFSVPAQSDSQAMMMLLTGKAGEEASSAGALLLLSAAGGLGDDSEEGISESITRFFRVDELAVKSDKGVDQSELWVGKYLTPRLLVRYVVGVFEQAFSFGVVYQLTDELRIEAVSGEEKSVDMIYKIER